MSKRTRPHRPAWFVAGTLVLLYVALLPVASALAGDTVTRFSADMEGGPGAWQTDGFWHHVINPVTIRPPVLRSEQPEHPAALMFAEDAAINPPLLHVAYDAATDRLSVSARRSLLIKVLSEIRRKTRVQITAARSELLHEEVSVEIPGMELEEALRQLLRNFNSLFLYSRSETPRGARLSSVVLISTKEGAASAAPPTDKETQPARRGVSNEDQQDAERLLVALEATVRSKPTDFSRYRRAVDTTRRLAPDRVVDPFARTLLENTDPEIRVYAATILGHLADHRAVDALARAFLQDGDSLARQAAMYSLIRIGGEMALEPVFQAFKVGTIELQKAIALALARRGDEQVREAFTKLIADAGAPPEVLTMWQLADPSRLASPSAGARR